MKGKGKAGRRGGGGWVAGRETGMRARLELAQASSGGGFRPLGLSIYLSMSSMKSRVSSMKSFTSLTLILGVLRKSMV